MAEMSVAALFAALFCATTAVAAWYVFKLVRGRASAEAEHYSKLIEIQDAHQTTREALIVKEAEVEALVRENQGIVARLQDVETEIKAERASNSLLQQELATLKTKLSEQATHHQEKLALLEEARSNLTLSFKQLAQEIFEAKQANFRDQSKEQLDGLLKPLNDRLKDFQARVETAYSEESRERFSLRNELKSLREMNTKISEDALNLTKALKGESKTQGTWGEVVLERVLEKSGLTKGREYDTQMSLKSDEGSRYQPDVIVHLPEGKDIIIDSKVSLTAYERMSSTDDEMVRSQALAEHVQSMRSHLKMLSEKSYHQLEGVRSLDFVLMFVPVEAAFSVGVQSDESLFADAFSRNIVIVTPTTLLVTLRTIENIWRYERQSANAQEIAKRAGGLYDKLVGFVADMEVIGNRLQSVQTVYDDAVRKLSSGRGNLIRRAESMRQLGAESSKSLPKSWVETDEAPADSVVEDSDNNHPKH